jgi:hypothetical protein
LDDQAHPQMALMIKSALEVLRLRLQIDWWSLSRRRRATKRTIGGTISEQREDMVEPIGIEPMTS